jgi:Glycosyl transferase 4-like domain/Glycosyl transferases group 1
VEPKHVLVVCYDFPGIYAAGVIRTYQLAKRLPDFGWQPLILTSQPCGKRPEDDTDIEVSDGELPCRKITAATARFSLPFRIDHYAPHKPPDRAVLEGNPHVKHLFRFGTQLAVPDGKISWVCPAVKRGLQVARDYPVHLCFSVSPRPTAHLVAYRLARRLNIPWVADFALPWSDAYWLPDRPRVVGWLDQRLEGLVVRSAQRITVAYADIARSISARFGRIPGDKIMVIPTGFEEDLFAEYCPAPSPKFTVVYPGNHFCEEGRHGEYFLKAIDEWLDLEPHLEEKVEFVFIGKRDDELLRQRVAMTHSKVVRVEPLISHRKCVQTILSSHMCVVNTLGNRIPAKVYECMRAGKWILALTDPGSDLEKMLRNYSKGVAVPAQDTFAIRNALQSTLQRSRSDKSERSEADRSLHMYSSNHGAERFSHIFEELLFKPAST